MNRFVETAFAQAIVLTGFKAGCAIVGVVALWLIIVITRLAIMTLAHFLNLTIVETLVLLLGALVLLFLNELLTIIKERKKTHG